MEWKVDKLLRFSEVNGINDALQGDTSLRWYNIEGNTENEDDVDPEEAEGIG